MATWLFGQLTCVILSNSSEVRPVTVSSSPVVSPSGEARCWVTLLEPSGAGRDPDTEPGGDDLEPRAATTWAVPSAGDRVTSLDLYNSGRGVKALCSLVYKGRQFSQEDNSGYKNLNFPYLDALIMFIFGVPALVPGSSCSTYTIFSSFILSDIDNTYKRVYI